MAAALAAASSAPGLEIREDPYRVGIVEVGDPVLLTYEQLTREMDRNAEMNEYIRAYGRPDYAEVQRIEMNEPYYPYEVRLYYLDGNRYVVFGRVHVAPTVSDFGTRKYIGKLQPEQLQRLLTAEPMVAPVERAADEPAARPEDADVLSASEPVVAIDVAAMPEVVEIVAEPATVVEVAPAAEEDDIELRAAPAAAESAAEN
jgi:hypothetical protein